MNQSAKFKSRKFLLALAAFLASFSAVLLGYFSNEPKLVMVAIICGAFSAAIYNFCESYVDAKAVSSNITTVSKNITASADDSLVVKKALEAEKDR